MVDSGPGEQDLMIAGKLFREVVVESLKRNAAFSLSGDHLACIMCVND